MGKSPLRHGQTVPACAEAALFHPRLAGRDDVEHIQPQLRYRRLRQGHVCAVWRVESAAIQAYALLAACVAWHLFFAAAGRYAHCRQPLSAYGAVADVAAELHARQLHVLQGFVRFGLRLLHGFGQGRDA